MTGIEETTEQAAARRSVDRAFPAIAKFLASDDASPDAPLMRVDAPQVTDAEALDDEVDTQIVRVNLSDGRTQDREFYEEERTHTVRLLDAPGSTMTVRCPSWCASDHDEDMVHGTFAADFAHRGSEEALHVDMGDGTAEDVLLCEITHYPFSSSDLRTPMVVMWPTLGMTEGHLDAPKLFGLADQLRQYASALDEVAVDLLNAQEETTEARRADLKERWAR